MGWKISQNLQGSHLYYPESDILSSLFRLPREAWCYPHYTGSSVGVKKRISSHKSDMSRGAGKDRGFCEHWATFHRGWMVPLGSLASLDPVAGMNKRDDARAGA